MNPVFNSSKRVLKPNERISEVPGTYVFNPDASQPMIVLGLGIDFQP